VSSNDPRDIIAREPMAALQVAIIAITIGLNALDGFDVLSISFASPGIAAEWHIDRALLGFVLSAELLGMALGSVFLGGLADKIGRRPTILGCLVVMATGMFMVTQSTGVLGWLVTPIASLFDYKLDNRLGDLAVWRVITGLGIGGMLAAINAVAAEFSNTKRRDLSVAIMSIGYPVGAALGGFITSASLTLADWPLYVNVGRIDWGKQSFTGRAQATGLVADRYGIEGTYQVAWGELRGFVNHFKISQGDVPAVLQYNADNTVNNADLKLYTRWRPWGREIKPFIGTHLRYSDHTDPAYWSPEKYAVGYVGLEAGWEDKYWTLAALGQFGFKLAGDASTAYIASIAAKRWLNDDWAIGMTAFTQGGTRTANYRANGASITVEKLW